MIVAVTLAPFVLLTAVFFVEVVAGLRRTKQEQTVSPHPEKVAILVPAHDEEQIIRETLAALKAAGGSSVRIMVVADNCVDSTATFARSMGVDVCERANPTQRGKGYALDYGRQMLRTDPPQVVIVL